jgi:hypothetical protein
MRCPFVRGTLQQFQEKCETVFRPELRQNKEIERFVVSVKRRTALATRGIKIKFTQSQPAACLPCGGQEPGPRKLTMFLKNRRRKPPAS